MLVIQTSGESINFNPHIHGIVTSGTFNGDTFHEVPPIDHGSLPKLFTHKVPKGLLHKELITQDNIDYLLAQKHTGFSAWMGQRLYLMGREGHQSTDGVISTHNRQRYLLTPEMSKLAKVEFIPALFDGGNLTTTRVKGKNTVVIGQNDLSAPNRLSYSPIRKSYFISTSSAHFRKKT